MHQATKLQGESDSLALQFSLSSQNKAACQAGVEYGLVV